MVTTLKGKSPALIACLTCAILILAGCRPAMSSLAGVELLMAPEEVEEALGRPSVALGQPLFYLGDADFRWSWYMGGIVVGFARSSAGELRAAWVLRTQGSLERKLNIGAPQAEAEKLYGPASAVAGLAEPRIRLKGEHGETLDIVLENGKVSAFFLCLPGGRGPDVRLTGTGPGELPTFELNHPGSIDICPTTPGTTWVYEEDMTGDSNMGLVHEMVKDAWSDGRTRVVVYRREAPGWEEPSETTVTIVGDVRFYEGRPVKPTRLYVGLEWSSSVRERNVAVRTEPLKIAAGQFPEALVVNFQYEGAVGHGGTAEHYVDGIGLVKRFGLELVQFHPGPD